MALRNRQQVLYLPMRVWDLPTRLFHWLLVVLLLAAYIARWLLIMPVHMAIGETVLALLLFRLVWGFVGSDTARFGRFLVSPLAGLRHLATFTVREPDTQIGHNAAGGWMVIVLLLVVAAQVCTGLCAHGKGHHSAGPLASYVGDDVAARMAVAHGVIFNCILAAVALHVLAVVGYAVFKRQDLVRPMISGKKRLPAITRAPRMASPYRALAVLVVCGAIAWAVATQL
jgi:cytochrome b